MVLTILLKTWEEDANSTEIEAIRQVMIQDMKILEDIAPESGAYFNEVRSTPLFTMPQFSSFFLLFVAYRLRDTNSIGRNPSSAVTTISSERSSENMTRNRSSSFTKVWDQTNGTQTWSAESESVSNLPLPLLVTISRGARAGGGLSRTSRPGRYGSTTQDNYVVRLTFHLVPRLISSHHIVSSPPVNGFVFPTISNKGDCAYVRYTHG